MALMADADRQVAWRALMRRVSQGDLGNIGITKQDFKAAVDATDAWIDGNAGAFNAALPVAARTNLTAQQKTVLFCYVAMRRMGMLGNEGL